MSFLFSYYQILRFKLVIQVWALLHFYFVVELQSQKREKKVFPCFPPFSGEIGVVNQFAHRQKLESASETRLTCNKEKNPTQAGIFFLICLRLSETFSNIFFILIFSALPSSASWKQSGDKVRAVFDAPRVPPFPSDHPRPSPGLLLP